jgi:hypothetical protein
MIGEWSEPFVVTMPRDKAVINGFLLSFLEIYLNIFPIIQCFLHRLGL